MSIESSLSDSNFSIILLVYNGTDFMGGLYGYGLFGDRFRHIHGPDYYTNIFFNAMDALNIFPLLGLSSF